MTDTSLIAGVALALGAAACYETGYALQALEARRAPRRHALHASLVAHLVRRPLWLGGTALSLAGWPLQVVALTLAPLTIVQPTLALGLLLLLFLGSRILDEPVGRREIVAATLVVAAVGTIAWASPDEIGTVTRGAALWVALAALAALTVAPYVVGRGRIAPAALLIAGAGAADGMAAFVSKLIAEDATEAAWLAAACWIALVAVAVGIGVVSESSALQRVAATRVAPAILAMQIVIPTVLAPLVGGESWANTPLGGAVLVGAIGVLGAGILLLGSAPAVAGIIAEAEGEGEGDPESELAAAGASAGD